MLTKQQILDAIKEMPGEMIDLEELREKLYLLNELQNAEDDIASGRTFTNQQMKEIIETWRQSSGQTLPKAIWLKFRAFVSLDSPLQADLLIDAIFTKAQILERFPEIGKKLKELPDKDYREILFKKYRIIYRLQQDTVFIMTIYHTSRLLKSNPFLKTNFNNTK